MRKNGGHVREIHFLRLAPAEQSAGMAHIAGCKCGSIYCTAMRLGKDADEIEVYRRRREVVSSIDRLCAIGTSLLEAGSTPAEIRQCLQQVV